MSKTQVLEEIVDLDYLIDGDVVNGTCLSVWEKEYSGEWTYMESRNWLVMRTNKNSIAILKINDGTKQIFKFKNDEFYITEDTGYNLDFFNSKTASIGQEINDYLERLKNDTS